MASEKISARDLVRRWGFDIDAVYAVINRHGMDAARLFPDDVARIRAEVRRSTTSSLLEESVVDMPLFRSERTILEIVNPETGVTRYIFADDLKNVSAEMMQDSISFSELVSMIETDIDYTPVEKRERGGGRGGSGGKPRGKKKEVYVQRRVAEHLLRNRDALGLRALLYGDPEGKVVELTHSSPVLSQHVDPETLEVIKATYRVGALTPEAMMRFGWLLIIYTNSSEISCE